MSSIILLDSSLSLAGAAIYTEEKVKTKKEVIQEGIRSKRSYITSAALIHFVSSLEKHRPLELIAVATFSSTFDVRLPFTRDFSKAKSYVYHFRCVQNY